MGAPDGAACKTPIAEYDYDRGRWIIRADRRLWRMRQADGHTCKCGREYSAVQMRALVLAQAPSMEDIASGWAA